MCLSAGCVVEKKNGRIIVRSCVSLKTIRRQRYITMMRTHVIADENISTQLYNYLDVQLSDRVFSLYLFSKIFDQQTIGKTRSTTAVVDRLNCSCCFCFCRHVPVSSEIVGRSKVAINQERIDGIKSILIRNGCDVSYSLSP